MNKELIEKVIVAIEDESKYFSMHEYFRGNRSMPKYSKTFADCGTASCIAGHTLSLLDDKTYAELSADAWHTYANQNTVTDTPVDIAARNALGIDAETANWLFYGGFTRWCSLADVTREDSVKALRHVLAGNPVTRHDDLGIRVNVRV